MTTASLAQLEEEGWDLVPAQLSDANLDALRDSVFVADAAGARCLLDHPLVAETARILLRQLAAKFLVLADAVAIQAIAFDKTAATNWKVAWHQDLMFPFARRVTAPGYDLPTVKDGIDHARPPCEVLENLLAVRLHLDHCGECNGPLRVSPGSHRAGVLRGADILSRVAACGQITCVARRGEALLMKPLTLHASSQATEPGHRRVLHFVCYCGPVTAEPWHRAIGIN
ncbi:MAG TPA: phytanoyl-CoA dioxygenase family protein [Chthoniobacterales bacterium]|jgi:hypothetical protein